MPDGNDGRRRIVIAALCLAGLGYRLVYVFDQVGRIDGDNAVVGLMARHILEGRHYAFFWGQHYLGTLEPYSIAAAGALFGLNDLVLRGVPLVYGALYMASFYWLGRALGGERTGRATLAAAALCPPLLAVWSSSPRGGYPEALFLGQAAPLLALRLARAPSGRHADGRAVLLGLVAGLAVWTHFLSITFLLVAAWVLLRADPGAWLRRRAWIAAVAFFAGSLPLWAYNLRHGFASFDLVGGAGEGASPLRSARMLLVMHGPKLLGVRDLVGGESILLGPFGLAAGALLATAVLWSMLRPAGGAKRDAPGRAEVSGALLLVVVALVLSSRYGTWNTQRYLLPAYSAILPLAASAWLDLHRRSVALASGAALLLLAVFGAGAVSLHRELSQPPRPDPWIPEAIAFLEERGIRHGYADHGEALVNTYRSGERVILQDTAIGRYPIAELASWEPKAILTARAPGDLAAGLSALGCGFRRRGFGGRELFYDVACPWTGERRLPREGWRVDATESPGEAGLAIDGDPLTRWASHAPQRPGMSFVIELGAPSRVAGVHLSARGFPGDFPRGLRVIGVSPDGDERTLAELPAAVPGLAVQNGHVHLGPETVVELRFEPAELRAVRLVQTGTHPLLDWSITEVDLIGE